MQVESEINLTPEERETLMKLTRSGLTSVRFLQRAADCITGTLVAALAA